MLQFSVFIANCVLRIRSNDTALALDRRSLITCPHQGKVICMRLTVEKYRIKLTYLLTYLLNISLIFFTFAEAHLQF